MFSLALDEWDKEFNCTHTGGCADSAADGKDPSLHMLQLHGMLHTELLCSSLPGVVAYDCDLYTQKADLKTRTVSSSPA